MALNSKNWQGGHYVYLFYKWVKELMFSYKGKMVKECTLSTGKLPLHGLPRNSVVIITDHTLHNLKCLGR